MNFEEFEVPNEVEVTLYTTICIANQFQHNIGIVDTMPYNKVDMYKNHKTDKYLLLNEYTTKIKIGNIKIDVKGEMIKGFEDMKEKELADHYMRMSEIQGNIDRLTAIEYKPSTEI